MVFQLIFFISIAAMSLQECNAESIFSKIINFLTAQRKSPSKLFQKREKANMPAQYNNIENAKNAIIVLHIFNELEEKNNDIFSAIPQTQNPETARPYHTRIRAAIVHKNGIVIVPKEAIHGATAIFASFDETFSGIMSEDNNFRCTILGECGPFAVIKIDSDHEFPTFRLGSAININPTDTYYLINDNKVINLQNVQICKIEGIDYVQFNIANFDVSPGAILIDQSGKLIGIFDCFATLNYNDIAKLAIDPNTIRGVIAKFINKDNKNANDNFGIIATDDFDMPVASRFKNGILVKEVEINSTGYNTGVLPGDIIVLCNGEPVESVIAFQNKIKRAKIIGGISIKVLRNNKNEVDIELF